MKLTPTEKIRQSRFAHILIIEDNPVDGYMMKSSLEELPNVTRVELFVNGSDVERWFTSGKAFKPDLIIMDVNLPDNDAFSLIDNLMEADFISDETPIMITSSQLNRRTEEMLERVPGFSLFLHKPIQPRYLQGLVS